ncbi:RNA polymerase sigma factor [Kallotenue papyrolyticum]|uniref:RNA polymerase sigma factor n=1 Tax=Kallotenue papyrolyticum TaxID=1325125 RepID=UPI0004785630|nr:sigma-70 family RNA polymerase sigma factor [Kallotenue papyrolyticum]
MQKPWEIDLTIYADEAELLAGLRRRDRMACTCLLKRYAPALYRLALRLTSEPDEAEDVLQEAFIRACDSIATFEGRSGLGTWLHRIVLTTALMRLRRQQPHVPLDDEGQALPLRALPEVHEPAHTLLSEELRNQIEAALLSLPTALRAAFVLRDLEGLSTREAADALGISEAALKVRLHRARLALRQALTSYLEATQPEEPHL